MVFDAFAGTQIEEHFELSLAFRNFFRTFLSVLVASIAFVQALHFLVLVDNPVADVVHTSDG